MCLKYFFEQLFILMYKTSAIYNMQLHNFFEKQLCIFFIQIDLFYYFVHKSIDTRDTNIKK